MAADSVNVQINASDADGDALTYSATNLPDGLDIDPFAGVISGTVADDAASTTPYPVTVTADDGNGQSVSQTFNWTINAPSITAQGAPVSAVEGNDTGSITVATFTTPDQNSQAGDFTATVNWGDGTTDVGSVSGANGSFTVTDDHTYAATGSYPVSVAITDSVTGGSATATTTTTVTAAPLTMTGGFQLGAVHQQPANFTLATFTDGNPDASAADFTATINWGDGSGTTAGMVGFSVNGVYSIGGSHAYSKDGTYTVTLTVTGSDGATATTTSTVAVGDLYAGLPSSLTVFSFTDSDLNDQASNFTATINWGDGNSSSGTVTGSNGLFSVQGNHTYAVDSLGQAGGTYAVTVSIANTNGAALTGSSTVTVVRPQLSLSVANQDIASSLSLNNVQVAAFTDPDPGDAAGEFTAQIDWGDGSTGSGTIQEVSPGLFQVIGSHTYATYDWYTITVTISQGWSVQEPAAKGAAEAGGKPIVSIINLAHPALNTLSVAKWENAFQRVGNTKPPVIQLKNNFISLDPDRFFVSVYDPAANKNPAAEDTLKVYVSTSSDTGHDIVLKETGNNTGKFFSAYLLLASVNVDKTAAGALWFFRQARRHGQGYLRRPKGHGHRPGSESSRAAHQYPERHEGR